MKLTPYLNFDGDCARAFRFYQQLLGGELEMMTFGDSPVAGDMPPEARDQILHACLMWGDVILMASDAPAGQYSRPAGVYVSLALPDLAETERVWSALADGGDVQMPFEKTFWAERFGMLTDRFGTPWMLTYDPAA